MSRLERAVNLLNALVETSRPLTRAEIFERVPGYDSTPASRRAFERDKEMLRAIGVPVSAHELDPGNPEDQIGYRVDKSQYYLEDLGLTNDEASALAIAAAAVRVGENSTAAALLKVGAEPSAAQDEVDLRDDARLADLFAARKDLRVATFTYHSKERNLEVHRLSFRRGRWYVSGHDQGYDTERTYRVDRIEGSIALSQPNAFAAPVASTQPWLPAWRLGDDTVEPVTAVLAVDANHVDIVAAQVGPFGKLERAADGSARLTIEVLNQEAFCSWVMDFLDNVEILEPGRLRSEFVQRLERLVAK